MLKNYLKIAFRNLVKSKIISFINVFGLSIGIACFILIFSYFYNEMTYDSFNKDAKDIYRIYSIEKTPQGIQKRSETPDPLASALRNNFPSSNTVSLTNNIKFPVTINGRVFHEKVCQADPGIFSFFSFPFLQGNPKTALKNPTSVVITESLAKKYFGKKSAMGKIILLFNKYPLMVSGVLKRIPSNSSIQLNVVVSKDLRKHFFPGYKEQWTSSGSNTFVKCTDSFTESDLKSALQKIKEKYLPVFLKHSFKWNLGIQPLTSIHLRADIKGGMVPPVPVSYLYALLAIALSIISIACINFMNLTSSRLADRLKEINVRKVLGSKKYQLVIQILSESIFLSFIALIIGLALVEVFLPGFDNIIGKDLSAIAFTSRNLLYLVLFGLLIGVISGLYPALLSSSRSILTLKNNAIPGGNINTFRKGLLTAQFAISVVLISCIIIVSKQIQYMKNFNLGFDKENILSISLSDPPGMISQGAKTFANIIKSKPNPGIKNATVSENIPGYYFNNEFGVIPEGCNKSQAITMVVTSADENFLKTYKIPLFEGRNFSKDFGTDSSEAVLINRTALKKIGWKSAVGKTITFAQGGGSYKVIGVIKDIHYKSLQNRVEPLVIRFAGYGYMQNFLSVRISSSNVSNTINYLREEWHKIIPGKQFNSFFLDNKYDDAYNAEEKTAAIIGTFSFLAIMLASLGLLGLTIITITQKTKEIGIRKVLGASITNIFLLTSKQFIKIILIADLFAFPAAYLLMKHWLMNYPYRITLNISFFIISGLLVLIVSLLTISFWVIKAASANPVKSLRYE